MLHQTITTEEKHNVYVLKNNELIGWINMQDEIRPEAKAVVDYFKSKNIKTILLSGDRKEKCELLAKQLNIDEVFAEQTPNKN